MLGWISSRCSASAPPNPSPPRLVRLAAPRVHNTPHHAAPLRAAGETIDAPVALDPALRKVLDALPREDDRWIVCRACDGAITRPTARIDAGGSHEHHFTNPYGVSFHVGCFADAPGCVVFGDRQHADTWFAGHTWRLAACSHCGEHLGWLFEGPTELAAFYGLILPRLQERADG